MIQLSEGLYSWNTFNEEKCIHFNGFLVFCKEGTVVIDPPPHTPVDEAFLDKKLKPQPNLAIVTNKHHLRNVQWWLDRFKIPLAMYEDEPNDYDFVVTKKLKEGQVVAGELEIIHLPGKTAGEIGLYLERSGGTVILGDSLIGDPPGFLKLLPKEKLQDQEKLELSLRKLRSLSFQRLLLGDGEPLLGNAKQKTLKFLDALPKVTTA